MMMKVLFLGVVLLGSSLAFAARLDGSNRNYVPPFPTPSQINNALTKEHQRPVVTPPPPAIIRLNNENQGDGTYRFDFETENQIVHQETGQVRNAGTDQENNVIQGSYSYTGPDGIVYTVNYIADENGFRASGDHIPTAAPVPQEIAEAVQQNIADEAAGIVDDGQYRAEYDEAPRFRNQNNINAIKSSPGYNQRKIGY